MAGVAKFKVAAFLAIAGASCGGRSELGGAGQVDASAIVDHVAADVAWSDDVALQYRGGSRLRPIWWTTAEGQWQFSRWYDTLLDVDCAFLLAADGATRCLPTPRSPGPLAGDVRDVTPSTNYYSDAACAHVEVVLWNRAPNAAVGCAPPVLPRFGLVRDFDSCPVRTHVFPIDAKHPLAAVYTYSASASPTSCFAVNDVPGNQAYPLGDELSPNSYVRATESRGVVAGGVAPRYFDGDDGSRGFAGWYNAEINANCTFWPNDSAWVGDFTDARGLRLYAQDGTVRCLPDFQWAYRSTNVFADPSCSQQTSTNVDSHCPQEFAYTPVSAPTTISECRPLTSVARIIQTNPPTAVYLKRSDGTCAANPTSQKFFESEAPLDADALGAPGTVLPPGGTSRIRPWKLSITGGLMQSIGWFDAQLETDCVFELGTDRALHCVPDGRIAQPTAEITSGFSDPSCTQPMGTSWQYACLPLWPFAIEFDTRTSTHPDCYGPAPFVHVFPVGSPAARPFYEQSPTGNGTWDCTEMPASESFEGVVFDLGAELDPSSFVSVTEGL